MAVWLEVIKTVCAPGIMVYTLIGVGVGLVIGTLPGLTSTMAIAILTPLTFWLDPINGAQRYTFGNVNMLDGISFIPVMIGLFGLGEMCYQIFTEERAEDGTAKTVKTTADG